MNNQAPTFQQFQTYQPGRADIDAATFAALLPNAESWVDEFIFPNSVNESTRADVLAAYQKAICAIVCTDNDYPEGVSKGYTSGKVREEFDADTIPSHANIARQYLSGSGLLCRWL